MFFESPKININTIVPVPIQPEQDPGKMILMELKV